MNNKRLSLVNVSCNNHITIHCIDFLQLITTFSISLFTSSSCVSGEAILSQSKSFCFIDSANESENHQFPQKSHKRIFGPSQEWVEQPFLTRVKTLLTPGQVRVWGQLNRWPYCHSLTGQPLVTFETLDQIDLKTWHDNDK